MDCVGEWRGWVCSQEESESGEARGASGAMRADMERAGRYGESIWAKLPGCFYRGKALDWGRCKDRVW